MKWQKIMHQTTVCFVDAFQDPYVKIDDMHPEETKLFGYFLLEDS
jgi:hypothetical protein